MVGFYRENQNTLGKWPTAGTADSATASELGERIERYFRVHPEASRKAFLLEAVRHELSLREQPQSTGPKRYTPKPMPAATTSIKALRWPHAWQICIISNTVFGRG